MLKSFGKDLIAASSVPIILAVLNREQSYGYQIIQKIKEHSKGDLEFAEGTLYPILRKLEAKDYITSEWRIAENEKRRRYYCITPKGRDHFKEEETSRNFINQLINELWNQPKPNLI